MLALADAQGCVLLTEDKDFGELVVVRHLPAVGVVLDDLDRLSNQAEAERWSSPRASGGARLRRIVETAGILARSRMKISTTIYAERCPSQA